MKIVSTMMAKKVWLAFLVFYIGKSVAELCQEGQLEAVTDNCFKFRLCRERQWKELTCAPPYQVFDSFQGKCVSTHRYCLSNRRSNEHCSRDLCMHNLNIRCTDGQKKTLGCKHYLECISGDWIQVECKKGETVKKGRCSEGTCLFTSHSCREYTINGEHINCESGYYYDEILSKCTPGFCKSPENVCTEGEAKGVEGTCKKYKKCIGGVFVDKQCSQCQNFDENSKKCVFIWDRPCGGEVISTTILPPTIHTSTPSTHTTTFTTPSPIKCLPGKRKPDYSKCSHYFECDKNGNWQNKSCWWVFFFFFDIDSSSCKFWTAKCARK